MVKADLPVTVLDEVTLPGAEVDAWLARWRDEYLPAARGRGLELVGVWRGFTRDPDHVDVVVQWSLAGSGAFWAARGQAAADPTVAAFWAGTDAVAVRRDRRVLVAAGGAAP